jgi:DNA gyrase subunit A
MGMPSLAAGAPLGAIVEIPSGVSAVGLIPIHEAISALVVTRNGIVKRIASDIPGARANFDLIALENGDEVVSAQWLSEQTAETSEICLVSSQGQLLRFPASGVRPQGRSAAGVAGMKLSSGDHIIFGGAVHPENAHVVTVAGSSAALPGVQSESVKVTALAIYPMKGRNTQGVKCHKFRKGEDALTYAWVGPGLPRAASAAGAPIDLPAPDARRDGTGTATTITINACGPQ